MGRWGLIVAPEESHGSYVLIERETSEGWKKPPPADALRMWARRPGDADDDDHNWTLWDTVEGMQKRLSACRIEWLPPGEEPDWAGPDSQV